MSKLNINRLTNENEDGSPKISGISTFSSTHYFVPPSGSTAERPSHADPGMIRFNTDSGHLEYYNGVEWTSVIVNNYQVGISTNPAGTSGGLGTRALFCRGNTNAPTVNRSRIDYITMTTLGNAIEFGEDLVTDRQAGALASSTRALIAGRTTANDTISFVTISSTGNGQDFANLVLGTAAVPAGLSNETRGIFAGGIVSPSVVTNKMDYVTIASQGVDAQDFGDLTSARETAFGCASSTRGIIAGGRTPTFLNSIDYITFSSTGDAQNFGDMSSATDSAAMGSNSTRGVFGGGRAPGLVNTIEFITIASTGNAIDFGDLLQAKAGSRGAASSTRMVFAGGYNPISPYNDFTNGAIEYVEIATTGNGQGFGDLTINREQCAGCSNGHGGL